MNLELTREDRRNLNRFISEVVDRTLQRDLTGEEFIGLTPEQSAEMDAKLRQHLIDAIEGFELEIPPSDAEMVAAEQTDRDEGRYDDGLGPIAA